MYVCVHAHVYLCADETCVYVCVISIASKHVCEYRRVCDIVNVKLRECSYERVYVSVLVCVCECVNICTSVYANVGVCVQVYLYVSSHA